MKETSVNLPYVLVILASGDSGDYGRRVSSVRFATRQAAQQAQQWLIEKSPHDIRATIIADTDKAAVATWPASAPEGLS